MQRVPYADEDGRNYTSLLPDGTDVDDAYMGVLVGPPNLSKLGLPIAVEVRLHNELFARDIHTFYDARAKVGEVVSALQAALRTDAQAIVACYASPGET